MLQNYQDTSSYIKLEVYIEMYPINPLHCVSHTRTHTYAQLMLQKYQGISSCEVMIPSAITINPLHCVSHTHTHTYAQLMLQRYHDFSCCIKLEVMIPSAVPSHTPTLWKNNWLIFSIEMYPEVAIATIFVVGTKLQSKLPTLFKV